MKGYFVFGFVGLLVAIGLHLYDKHQHEIAAAAATPIVVAPPVVTKEEPPLVIIVPPAAKEEPAMVAEQKEPPLPVSRPAIEKSAKIVARRPNRYRHRVAKTAQAPLPYSCATIRAVAPFLSEKEKDDLVKSHHLTPVQVAAAKRCFKD